MSRLGPGAFVAIVGPSGSGKDSVLRGARETLERAMPGQFHFVRRMITRGADDGAEAHEPISPERFGEIRAAGGFALWWEAHGCSYGLSSTLDRRIAAGQTVVANLSRAVLADMRLRYARAFAVEVTAPLPVLAARIASRGRESGAEVEARLARSERFCGPEIPYELTIDNSGPLDDSVATLARFLAACRVGEPAL